MRISVASFLLWADLFIAIAKGSEISRSQHSTADYKERKPFILEDNLPYTHRQHPESKDFGYRNWDSWTPDRSQVTSEYRPKAIRGRKKDYVKSTGHEDPSADLRHLITNLNTAHHAIGAPASDIQKEIAKAKDSLHEALLMYNNLPSKHNSKNVNNSEISNVKSILNLRSSVKAEKDGTEWERSSEHHKRYGVQHEIRSLLRSHKKILPEAEEHRTNNLDSRGINNWLNHASSVHKDKYTTQMESSRVEDGSAHKIIPYGPQDKPSKLVQFYANGFLDSKGKGTLQGEPWPKKKLSYLPNDDKSYKDTTKWKSHERSEETIYKPAGYTERHSWKNNYNGWATAKANRYPPVEEPAPHYYDSFGHYRNYGPFWKSPVIKPVPHHDHDEYNQYSGSSHLRNGVFKETEAKQWKETESKTDHSGVTTNHKTPRHDREGKVIHELNSRKPILGQSKRYPYENTEKWQFWEGHNKVLQYEDEIHRRRSEGHTGSRDKAMANYKTHLIPDDREMKGSRNYEIFNPRHPSLWEVPRVKKISSLETGFNSPLYTNYHRYGDTSHLMLPSHKAFERPEGRRWEKEEEKIKMTPLNTDVLHSSVDAIYSVNPDSKESILGQNKRKPSQNNNNGAFKTNKVISWDHPYIEQFPLHKKDFHERMNKQPHERYKSNQRIPEDETYEFFKRKDATSWQKYRGKEINLRGTKFEADAYAAYGDSNNPTYGSYGTHARLWEKGELKKDIPRLTYKLPFHKRVGDGWTQNNGKYIPQDKSDDIWNGNDIPATYVYNDKSKYSSTEKGGNKDYSAARGYPYPYREYLDDTALYKHISPVSVTSLWVPHQDNKMPVSKVDENDNSLDEEKSSISKADWDRHQTGDQPNQSLDRTYIQVSEGMETSHVERHEGSVPMQIRTVGREDIRNSESDSLYVQQDKLSRDYKPIPFPGEVANESMEDLSNEKETVQQSNEKGITEYATTNTPATDGMDNPISDDKKHKDNEPVKMQGWDTEDTGTNENVSPYLERGQTTTEYLLTHVEGEVTLEPIDDLTNEEKAMQNSTVEDITEFATPVTPVSEEMENPSADDGKHMGNVPIEMQSGDNEDDGNNKSDSSYVKHENTTTLYIPNRVGGAVLEDSVDDHSDEEMAQNTTNTPESDLMENPTADDERRKGNAPIEMQSGVSEDDGTNQTDSPYDEHEHTTTENITLPYRGEESAVDRSDEETPVTDSNEKGRTEYDLTNIPVIDGKGIPTTEISTTDETIHEGNAPLGIGDSEDAGNNEPDSEQTTRRYIPMRVGGEVTTESLGALSNVEKPTQDSNEKGNTTYATTNTPVSGGMENPTRDDGRHEDNAPVEMQTGVTDETGTTKNDSPHVEPETTTREYVPNPVASVDNLGDEDIEANDSNGEVNIENATTDTTVSDDMDNPTADDGRREVNASIEMQSGDSEDGANETDSPHVENVHTTTEYIPVPVGGEESAVDLSSEEKPVKDSNEKGSTEHTPTNTPVTGGKGIPTTGDGRHENNAPIEIQPGETEDLVINENGSPRVELERTTNQYIPMPVGGEVTTKSLGELNDNEKAIQDTNEKGNTEYATTTTPVRDGIENSTTDDGIHEEYEPVEIQTDVSDETGTTENDFPHVEHETTTREDVPKAIESVDNLGDEDMKMETHDANEEGNTENATTNTTVSDVMDNTTTDNERSEVTAVDLSNEEKPIKDSNEKGSTEYTPTYTPITDGKEIPTAADGRHEDNAPDETQTGDSNGTGTSGNDTPHVVHETTTTGNIPKPVVGEVTAASVDNLSDEEKEADDANEEGNTENVTTNAIVSDVTQNPTADDGRREDNAHIETQSGVGEVDGTNETGSPYVEHVHTTTEYIPVPVGGEESAVDLSDEGKPAKVSTEKEGADYAPSSTPVIDGENILTTDDGRHEGNASIEIKSADIDNAGTDESGSPYVESEQTTRHYIPVTDGEEVTTESLDDLSNIEKPIQDSIEKVNTNTPESDGIENPTADDGIHENNAPVETQTVDNDDKGTNENNVPHIEQETTTTEYVPKPVVVETTTAPVDNLNDVEVEENDSNEQGNTPNSTTNTTVSDTMENTTADDGRREANAPGVSEDVGANETGIPYVDHVHTTTEYVPMPVAGEESVVDPSDEEKAVKDSNGNGSTEYTPTNKPVTDGKGNPTTEIPTTDDERHEGNTPIEIETGNTENAGPNDNGSNPVEHEQ